MRGYDARVFDGSNGWVTETVRLLIRDPDGQVLMADGSWVRYAEGEVVADGAGVVLPRASVEAIAVAIAEWQGHMSHADTEARVLREWLAVERGRVDRALGR